MKRLLSAHVESSHIVLRYMGGIIAQTRAAQMQNRKLSLFLLLMLLFLFVFHQPLKKESLNAKPYPSTRPTPRQD
jgi:hypothetical protein